MLDFLLASKQDFNAFINCEIKIIPSFLVIKPMSRDWKRNLLLYYIAGLTLFLFYF